MAERKNLNETLKFKFVMSEIRNSMSTYGAYNRLIKTSAYRDTLKEISMNLKVQLIDDSESFFNYLKTYWKNFTYSGMADSCFYRSMCQRSS